MVGEEAEGKNDEMDEEIGLFKDIYHIVRTVVEEKSKKDSSNATTRCSMQV